MNDTTPAEGFHRCRFWWATALKGKWTPLAVAMYLASCADNKTDKAVVKIETIAARVGITRARVTSSLRLLTEAGIIAVERCYKKASIYTINFAKEQPPLPTHIVESQNMKSANPHIEALPTHLHESTLPNGSLSNISSSKGDDDFESLKDEWKHDFLAAIRRLQPGIDDPRQKAIALLKAVGLGSAGLLIDWLEYCADHGKGFGYALTCTKNRDEPPEEDAAAEERRRRLNGDFLPNDAHGTLPSQRQSVGLDLSELMRAEDAALARRGVA